tara:strand:+ start:377 stop:1657 length:1281 start_codon:yes stop_codon:yes gene_type:complete
MHKIFFIIILLLFSCDENNVNNSSNHDHNRVYVSLQDSDAVSVVSSDNLEIIDEVNISLSSVNCSEFESQMECEMSGCMWHEMDNGMSHCMNMDMGGGMYAPHDISVDNTNGYWFTTAMSGFQVAMYSTENNELIATYQTESMPALLSVDEVYSKVYVSGGMPMNGPTNKILELEYNENSLELIEEWDVQFTYAHGIHFDEISGNVFAVSKTADFIAKFDPNQVQVPFVNPMIASMDSSINTNFNIEPRRLWPIEISGKYPYLFVTCSAGDWSSGSNYEEIPGQVQMWDMRDLSLLTTYEFETYSRPWHIEVSPYEDKIYVSLSGGDGANGSSNSGVACLEYSVSDSGYEMNQSWMTTSPQYGTLHGITLHSDCDGNYHIYSTGRSDGSMYKFDAITGTEIGSVNLISTGSVRTGGIDSFTPPCVH